MSILDLIDGAIEAHEVSSDAMRWTAEPVEPPWYAEAFERRDGLATGGVIHGGGYYLAGETGCDLHGSWFWDIVSRQLPQMGRELSRVLDETHVWTYDTSPVTFTLDNSEATFRRTYLNDEVPSGLSRESNPASTERTTP